jgi:cytoskeletal protein CcmA (bactofilin family)
LGKHDINAFLGAGTSFAGRLAFGGVVRIDGHFEGEIVSSGTLVVGNQATVAGRIEVGRLVCDGLVAADVAATASVAVHGRGRLSGSVRTPSLSVAEGGRVDGAVVMETGVEEPRPALAAGCSAKSSQTPQD